MVIEQNKEALFEDLGDLTLYSWFKCRRSPDQTEDMYRKVLDALAILHTTITDHVSECPLLQGRVFDYSHLKWETEYFLERFVRGTMGLTVGKSTDLENDLDGLARTVDAFAKTVVHRDFQSQNIMIPGDSLPRLIDYQGARIGPPAYDVSSILWDPYNRIEHAMRERLLDHYLLRISEFRIAFDETAFRQSILPCRLQRHMQALGAYGYLSEVKGKRYFHKYVPQALAYLKEEADMAREEYPSLCSLIKRLS
jgi:aminoglycoside/choline kinase family phosphotransferase